MKTKAIYCIVAVVAVLTTTILTTGLFGIALAQNSTAPPQSQTADPTQIKSYLTEAIQALDSGNNTQALKQVDLAGDRARNIDRNRIC